MIAIASDHTATQLKSTILTHLKQRGFECEDYGTNSLERVDYPVYAEKVAVAVSTGVAKLGILVCGTGIGMSLAANKVKGIRAAVCSEPYSAKLTREHNDSNILCIGARVVGDELAKMIVDCWIDAEFEGGRHADRVNMIMDIEAKRDKE